MPFQIFYRTLILATALLILVGCVSGKRYRVGACRFERFHSGIIELERDPFGTRYNLFASPVSSAGSTWQGNQLTCWFKGIYTQINVPGSQWLIYYPVQRIDAGPEAKAFGIGSGDGDLRISLLFGFLSLGREWNVLWIRGFWFGKKDPAFRKTPPQSTYDYFESIEKG